MKWIFLAGALLSASAAAAGLQTPAMPAVGVPHVPVQKEMSSAINKGFTVYFRTINYSAMVCTSPRVSADVALVVSGESLFGNPAADGEWLRRQKSAHNCWQQPPDAKFTVTSAYPVYINGGMVSWVVGVTIPTTGDVLGYIPIDQIQVIPIPTL